MKRYGNLFDKAFSKDNIYQAYLDARKGKRTKRSCFEFEKSLGTNIDDLYDRINSGIYKPDKYFKFEVFEPKKRTIHAPSFRDVVVQHAIYRIIYDIFDHSFIDTSFACRIGKGTHKAARYVKHSIQQCDGDSYILKLDVRKFFYSINRGILRTLIERKIKDKRFIDVMMLFAEMETEEGIPIGNLLSQIYALIFLNPLDHFVKRVLKIKRYVRYVDDFMLIGISREECLVFRRQIVDFLWQVLGLTLSKSTIQKIRKGVNFCGYRMWRSLTVIRKHSLIKFMRAIKKEKQASVNSLLGHAKRTNSLHYMILKLKEEIRNGKNLQIPQGFRQIRYSHLNRAGLQSA